MLNLKQRYKAFRMKDRNDVKRNKAKRHITQLRCTDARLVINFMVTNLRRCQITRNLVHI